MVSLFHVLAIAESIVALYSFALQDAPQAPAYKAAGNRVKLSAASTKLDADGKQVVTITLEIEKGYLVTAPLLENPHIGSFPRTARAAIS